MGAFRATRVRSKLAMAWADALGGHFGTAEGRLEERPVVLEPGHLGGQGVLVRDPHLDGIDEGLEGLVLEIRRASVPELLAEEEGVQGGRGVAGAELAADSRRGGGAARIGEAGLGRVTGGAGDAAVAGQARIEVELLAELHLGCAGRVVRGDLRLQHAVGNRQLELRAGGRHQREAQDRDRDAQRVQRVSPPGAATPAAPPTLQ